MDLSIVYVTCRAEPRLDWLLDGIEAQAVPGLDEVCLVVVDGYAPGGVHPPGRDPVRSLESCGWRALPDVVTDVDHVRPKPTPWQGYGRVTDRDWWAISSARNTGLVEVAERSPRGYVVFLDDRCKIGPQWLEAAREVERTRDAVIAGSYDKVEDGAVTQDHRRRLHPSGLVDCGGGWLYGCSVGLPIPWALEVNGFEEGCDGLSGEDYVFGLMLANAGRRIDFDPRMLVIQDRSVGTSHGVARRDKGASPDDKSHAALARFGRARRTEFTPDLGRLVAARRSPPYDYAWPPVDPDSRDWYDGQPIREMTPG